MHKTAGRPKSEEVPFEKALLDQMEALSVVFSGKFGRVISTLIGAGQQDVELSEAILENYLLPRRQAAKKFFKHAIESKQIRPLPMWRLMFVWIFSTALYTFGCYLNMKNPSSKILGPG